VDGGSDAASVDLPETSSAIQPATLAGVAAPGDVLTPLQERAERLAPLDADPWPALAAAPEAPPPRPSSTD
jgi:hypothetical protein